MSCKSTDPGIQSLVECTKTNEFEDFGNAALVGVSLHGPLLVLRIELFDGTSDETTMWEICATGVRDYRFQSASATSLALIDHPSHPAILQYTDIEANLLFGNPAHCGDATVGALFRAHQRISERWIPFERYMNDILRLEDLVVRGSGALASGPKFILDGYFEAASASGMEPYFGPVYTSRNSAEDHPVDPSILSLDGQRSYIVADKMSASVSSE